ncbi:hypothetical protein F5Y18DRAFT_147250 [Xylariaceae sp. FL1019]|nr:hypothetical protein F5Y18DRAFT_147250 [Xylariaceae sp. FL1019]
MRLGNRRDGSRSGDLGIYRDVSAGSGVLLRAIPRDVTSLAALVASLACGVQRATVGGGAVSGDVTKLPTSVALHSLSLAVTGEVVRTTALVASSRTRATSKTATTTVAEATTTHGNTTAHGCTSRVGAGTSQVPRLAAVVASTIAGASAAQTECRAVSLNMSQTLAMVALLGLGSTRKRALVRLVAFIRSQSAISVPHALWCQSVVTYLAACSYSKGAQRRSRPRRSGQRCHICSMLYEKEKTWRQKFQSIRSIY